MQGPLVALVIVAVAVTWAVVKLGKGPVVVAAVKAGFAAIKAKVAAKFKKPTA